MHPAVAATSPGAGLGALAALLRGASHNPGISWAAGRDCAETTANFKFSRAVSLRVEDTLDAPKTTALSLKV